MLQRRIATSTVPEVSGLLLDYLRVVYWRRWLAASVFLTVAVGVAVHTFTATPVYEAQATALIETDDPNVVNFKRVLDEGVMHGGYYETQIELLKSRSLAERTVAALGLSQRPEFGTAVNEVAPGLVSDGMRVTQVRGSRTVDVRFRSSNPVLAAEVVNTHLRQYVRQSLENRYRASKEATEWLDAQLAKERKRVEERESALQAYREQHDAVSLKSGQDIVVQKLADLNAAVTKAKTSRIDKEVQYRDLQAVQRDPALLDSFPAILSNPFVQQLKGDLARLQREYAQLSESLGERHPTLIEKRTEVETTDRRLAAEVQRVVQSVEGAFRAAQAEEASLTRALAEQKREALLLSRRGIEYAALERDAESVRLVYQSLLQRAKETSVSRDLRDTNIRIIDLAEPPTSPVLPRRWTNVSIGAVAGVLLALAAVFLVEFLDDRITTPEDLRQQLGVAFLGLLPEMRSKEEGRISILQNDVPASFIEAVRGMRTGVVTSFGEKHARSILVASATEGEGKTVVAANLAIALAQAHQRVLLIDADMRRSSVHEIFGHGPAPGLSNVLAGTAMLADVFRLTAVPGLTMVSAGDPSPHASELLGSTTFTELFEIVEEHFAWVIIDSPPVLTVTDASVVACRTSGIVFVVGCGMTSSRAARLGLEELRRAGGRVVGGVLNRADLKRHPFYFSPYSPREYHQAEASAVLGKSA
jgi:succinoglycan biosynthesis transport protein ExoP